jgi:hypothetical protein
MAICLSAGVAGAEGFAKNNTSRMIGFIIVVSPCKLLL